MKQVLVAAPLALALAACSASPAPEPGPSSSPAGAAPTQSANPPASVATEEWVGDMVLTLRGLGKLRIGQPVPPGSGWAERGAQASDTCRTVTSPDYPGVYAIVERGAVRRISVGERSNVVFPEGVSAGATRNQVDANFPGLRASPHTYVEGGADLVAPTAASGAVAVRFELDEKGIVTTMHVGTMPVLGYVEGCA